MNDDIERILRSLNLKECSAVEISGEYHGDLPWGSYETLRFPEFDLCEATPQRTYDVVICEQILEHVRDPWRAAVTLNKLCSPGGHVIVSTPFLVKIHDEPGDHWRFTATGLRHLLEQAGFRVSSVAAWGNASCARANFRAWVPHRPWNSLRNDPTLPLVVWAVARPDA